MISHFNDLNISTNNAKRNMTYKQYINQPMVMIELELNMNISENARLIISLDKSINHLSIRKNSNILFSIH